MKPKEWIFKGAKPWKFWLPQSGIIGGAILGLIFILVLMVLVH